MTTPYTPLKPWEQTTAADHEAAGFALWSFEGSIWDLMQSAPPDVRKAAAYAMANTLADRLGADNPLEDYASGILSLLDQPWDETTKVWGACLAAIIDYSIENSREAQP